MKILFLRVERASIQKFARDHHQIRGKKSGKRCKHKTTIETNQCRQIDGDNESINACECIVSRRKPKSTTTTKKKKKNNQRHLPVWRNESKLYSYTIMPIDIDMLRNNSLDPTTNLNMFHELNIYFFARKLANLYFQL
jgi:hypothetical protein